MIKYLAVVFFFLSYHQSEAHYGRNRLDVEINACSVCADVRNNLGDSSDFTAERAPIPYAGLDISRALNPWHDIRMLEVETITGRRIRDKQNSIEDQLNSLLTATGLAYSLLGCLTVLLLWQWGKPSVTKR